MISWKIQSLHIWEMLSWIIQSLNTKNNFLKNWIPLHTGNKLSKIPFSRLHEKYSEKQSLYNQEKNRSIQSFHTRIWLEKFCTHQQFLSFSTMPISHPPKFSDWKNMSAAKKKVALRERNISPKVFSPTAKNFLLFPPFNHPPKAVKLFLPAS